MIFVFKTSVKNKTEVRFLGSYLNTLLQEARWNFDLDDCDKILRIESHAEITDATIKLLQAKGFECVELR